MSEDTLKKILAQLDRISYLLASQSLNQGFEKKSQTEKAGFLSAAGFDYKEIAKILNTTPATISVRLAEHRRGNKTR
jgi:hypothetical protein